MVDRRLADARREQPEHELGVVGWPAALGELRAGRVLRVDRLWWPMALALTGVLTQHGRHLVGGERTAGVQPGLGARGGGRRGQLRVLVSSEESSEQAPRKRLQTTSAATPRRITRRGYGWCSRGATRRPSQWAEFPMNTGICGADPCTDGPEFAPRARSGSSGPHRRGRPSRRPRAGVRDAARVLKPHPQRPRRP